VSTENKHDIHKAYYGEYDTSKGQFNRIHGASFGEILAYPQAASMRKLLMRIRANG
jgi:hypothetical protein